MLTRHNSAPDLEILFLFALPSFFVRPYLSAEHFSERKKREQPRNDPLSTYFAGY